MPYAPKEAIEPMEWWMHGYRPT